MNGVVHATQHSFQPCTGNFIINFYNLTIKPVLIYFIKLFVTSPKLFQLFYNVEYKGESKCVTISWEAQGW